MKRMNLVLMVAGSLAMPAMVSAADNTSSSSVATHVQKSTVPQRILQLLKQPEPVSDKIQRVGGISSRPWTQVAGWPPATPFADERYYQPHFNLFWVGNTPE
jgi:hypothetical protein